MTYIMSRRLGLRQFWLGDLMVSQEGRTRPEISLPGRFDPRLPAVPQELAELRQKLVVFNPRVVAAWAGRMVVASTVMSAIAEIADGFPSAEQIQAQIAGIGLSQDELDKVSLMFWSISEIGPGVRRNETHYLQVHAANIPNPSPDNLLIYSGSGAFHFLDIVTDDRHELERPLLSGADQPLDEGEWRLIDALSGHIMRAAQVLHDEMVDEVVHAFRYGGGFELIWETERGLEKLPMSQVFWRETKDTIELVGPIITQQYSPGGTLFIRRFHLQGEEWVQEVFPVHPPQGGRVEQCDTEADVFTTSTVHFFMGESTTKIVHAFGPDPIIRLHFDGRTMTMRAKQELFSRLANWPAKGQGHART